MQTPNITEIQRVTGAGASALTLGIIAAPTTELVKCFALSAVALVASIALISDALIRRGRAGIAEAAQYADAASEDD